MSKTLTEIAQYLIDANKKVQLIRSGWANLNRVVSGKIC